ncbi:SOS response-associated peptidase [Gelidibacter maritimus]|uniref:Abasic site processing protein n=1 Tax=Gelidibacter maritimus TaxID=2761487 RepID=A0A7W2R594_9FLAO|nr:SOS response-associated peptidase [Gelidibacter maritimus]MBA6154679.1 SOS response-associated peptidase [Gelidibacter maritimus]
MCYDIKATVETQLKRAKTKGDAQAVDEIMETLIPLTDLPLYHSSGFAHPELLIYTDRSPDYPEVATWGLVPDWVKDEAAMKKQWNNTLNARGETIFKLNSFRKAANESRCLIYIDGFYEHHHFEKKTYPFYIFKKDQSPIILAGLFNEWHNPETNGKLVTFSIVTTTGNKLLAKIHNNPKLKETRMPLILHEELADDWLVKLEVDKDQKFIKDLIQEYPEEELDAYPVGKLRGKDYLGNVPGISEPVKHEELVI